VNQPTPFLFAKGAGLMGEAGPEAIMPLTRTAGGQLGVKAIAGGGGGAITVNQYITVNADGTSSNETSASEHDAMAKALTERIRAVTTQEIVRQMRPGGILNKAGVQA
jgi:phage-related minor tail protein